MLAHKLGAPHFVRGIFALGVAQIFTWLSSAAMVVLLPRFLGDVNLGKLAFAMVYLGLIGLMADLGVVTYLTREVARDPSRVGKLTANALAMRVALSMGAGAVAAGSAALAGVDLLTQHILWVLALGLVGEGALNVMLGALAGLQKFKVLAATGAVGKIVNAAVVAAVLFAGAGPVEVGAASVIGFACGLVVAARSLRAATPVVLRFDWSVWRLLLLGGLPFFVWQAAWVMYARVDVVLLRALTSDAVIGWYEVAFRIIMIPAFVPTIAMTVVFPALSSAVAEPEAFKAIARRALHTIALLTVPMAVGVMLLADRVLLALGYPVSFANSAILLVLLAPTIALAAIDTLIGTALNAQGRQKQWALTAIAAAVLNPAANLVAIPYAHATFGNGAIAAAAITTLTEIFMMVVGAWLLGPSGVLSATSLTQAVKCVLASAIMAAVVWPLREAPIVVPVVTGALVYGGACLALGTVTLGELREIRTHLLRPRGALGAAEGQAA